MKQHRDDLVRRGGRLLRRGVSIGGPTDTRTPRPVATVADEPNLLRRGTMLTDGFGNRFAVVDRVRKDGRWWFRLINAEAPDVETTPREDGLHRRTWFELRELASLAYVKGERRERRESW